MRADLEKKRKRVEAKIAEDRAKDHEKKKAREDFRQVSFAEVITCAW